MTGRHEAPVRASDSWLADQLEAWVADFDRVWAGIEADSIRSASMTTEQMVSRLIDQSMSKTVLLCTVRQLIAEALTRNG